MLLPLLLMLLMLDFLVYLLDMMLLLLPLISMLEMLSMLRTLGMLKCPLDIMLSVRRRLPLWLGSLDIMVNPVPKISRSVSGCFFLKGSRLHNEENGSACPNAGEREWHLRIRLN